MVGLWTGFSGDQSKLLLFYGLVYLVTNLSWLVGLWFGSSGDQSKLDGWSTAWFL